VIFVLQKKPKTMTKNADIQKQVDKIIARMPEQVVTARDSAIVLDVMQNYVKFLDRLAANPAQYFDRDDGSLTIKFDGLGIRFADVDSFAKWIAENMQ
jgi:hypothetical protein